MKASDIVEIIRFDKTGIILDTMEMADGFLMVEVLYENEIDWFDEVELRIKEQEQEKKNWQNALHVKKNIQTND